MAAKKQPAKKAATKKPATKATKQPAKAAKQPANNSRHARIINGLHGDEIITAQQLSEALANYRPENAPVIDPDDDVEDFGGDFSLDDNDDDL